jgi:hypothetical protein
VAGAQRIDARGFENLQLAFDGAAIDGGAQRAQIVVVAYALQLQMAAVQEKPFSLSKAIVRMPNGVV